jgi:hypothetical protein
MSKITFSSPESQHLTAISRTTFNGEQETIGINGIYDLKKRDNKKWVWPVCITTMAVAGMITLAVIFGGKKCPKDNSTAPVNNVVPTAPVVAKPDTVVFVVAEPASKPAVKKANKSTAVKQSKQKVKEKTEVIQEEVEKKTAEKTYNSTCTFKDHYGNTYTYVSTNNR